MLPMVLERVRNLEIADELQRARKYWSQSGATNPLAALPLAFREAQK